jgi:hypothetical protein
MAAFDPWEISEGKGTDDFVEPLGHIPGAIIILLDELAGRVGELSGDHPTVAVCWANTRSA